MSSLMPLETRNFDPDTLHPKESLFLDGFRQRFSDLQDLLGNALFKAIAIMDQDETPSNELSMRERLVLMEKRGLIDLDKWQRMREIRNTFAHDYPDLHEEKAQNFNAAWESAHDLVDVVARVKKYMDSHYRGNLCD